MSILNRTIFYDDSTGVVRFLDWALVTTTLGAMVEPFKHAVYTPVTPVINFDPADETAKINRIERVDIHKPLFSDQGTVLHGGTISPKTGP